MNAKQDLFSVAKKFRDQLNRPLVRFTKNRALIIFLRHTGCTFCRQALADIARNRTELENAQIMPVFIHMSTETEAQPIFEKYSVADLPRIADPDQKLFRAFDVPRGSWSQVLHPSSIAKGVAGIACGYGIGRVQGDPLQMPGLFLIERGKIIRSYPFKRASDRPDYLAFACETTLIPTSK